MSEATAATGRGVLDRPARVLQVVHRYLPELGGTETHVAEVSSRLAVRDDLDLTVLATDRSASLPRVDVVRGVPVVRRRSWPRHSDLYVSPGVVGVIARGGWDLVHFQGVHTLVPPLGMATARAVGLPYVLTFHSGGHSAPSRQALRSVQWRVLAPLLRGAERLIAVSRFERSAFAAATGVPLERFVVVPNGGSLPAPRPPVAPVPGRILTSGRLERYKGHQRAIAALPAVLRQVPQAHVVVLGSGPHRGALEDLAVRLGVADRVAFRTVAPDERMAMAREVAAAAVMAALSDYEAHPVAVMEALALGVPVVGCDVAGTGDLVEDGLVTGVPLAAGDELVAGALVEQLAATATLGGAPHAPRAVGLPTWEDTAAGVADVYRQALTGHRGRAR